MLSRESVEELKKLKQGDYMNKVILTGRRAIYSESEIIKSLLLSEGIKKEDVVVIKDDPYNTFENIKVVSNYLQVDQLNKIIQIK